jgi:quinol-cytochrome oxidoreductase complex cytochrome b subunit
METDPQQKDQLSDMEKNPQKKDQLSDMEKNPQKNPQLSSSERQSRARHITKNFFLHIHATRVHIFSLKPTYTFGLGIILGLLFVIMVFTGVVLMMYYTPSVERAYESVKDIIFLVPGGRIIRNLHRWASYGMVIVAFLHLIRVFYTGSYLGKRSLNWVIGVVMLILVLLMSFSGYLLPWDQLSYWAVTIGSNIAASSRELTDLLGITNFFDIGGFLKKMLIGGETVGQPALSRFFTLHVIFLPLTLLTGFFLGLPFSNSLQRRQATSCSVPAFSSLGSSCRQMSWTWGQRV